jgi:hypothetical protein
VKFGKGIPCGNCEAPDSDCLDGLSLPTCRACRDLLRDAEGPVAFSASDLAFCTPYFFMDGEGDRRHVAWFSNGHWMVKPSVGTRHTNNNDLRRAGIAFFKALENPDAFKKWAKRAGEPRIVGIDKLSPYWNMFEGAELVRLELRPDECRAPRIWSGGAIQIAFRPRGVDDGEVRWFNVEYVRALRLAQVFVVAGDDGAPAVDCWPNPSVVLMGMR